MKSLICAAAFALAIVAAPAQAQDIDTVGTFHQDITNFGPAPSGAATFGQTFTVGGENALNSFTMYLDGGAGLPLNFQAYVYAWNGSRSVGDALYTSGLQTFTGSIEGNPTAFMFDTGAIDLVSGAQYVAFLSVTGLANDHRAFAGMPTSGEFLEDTYAGGDFVYSNSATFAGLNARDWDMPGGVFGDVQFKADFSKGVSPVPEPAAWAMMIGGFGLAGGMIRSRRRKIAHA
jgi:hypothetical protein